MPPTALGGHGGWDFRGSAWVPHLVAGHLRRTRSAVLPSPAYSCSCSIPWANSAPPPGTPRTLHAWGRGGMVSKMHDQIVESWSVVMRLGFAMPGLIFLSLPRGTGDHDRLPFLVPTPWAVYDAWRCPAKSSGYFRSRAAADPIRHGPAYPQTLQHHVDGRRWTLLSTNRASIR